MDLKLFFSPVPEDIYGDVVSAGSLNLKKIIIQADPNAARFYESVGAEVCGERESASIPGRMLPLYQLHL